MNGFLYNFLFPFLACTSAAFVIIAFYSRRVLQYHESRERNLRRMVSITRSRTIVLAMQFSRLHTLGQMYLISKGRQRENLRIRMLDYLSDALRHLKDALREGDGFEEGLFIDVVLESATEFNVELKAIQEECKDLEESSFFEHVLGLSSQCLGMLRENGEELVGRFNEQWLEIKGKNEKS